MSDSSLCAARKWLQAEVSEVEGLIARMAPTLQASYREQSHPHNALAAFERLAAAANAVVDARKEIFQIAPPETMWRKLDALAEAVDE